MNHGSYIDHLGLDICFDEYNFRKLQVHLIEGTHHLWLDDNNEAYCQESHLEHDLIYTIEVTWKCIFLFLTWECIKHFFFSTGNNKAKALHLLRMIAESAAKINAMEFFTIIFSTSVGRTVFKSFKDEEILLEDVARENGHEELACFLQERHFM